METLRRSAVVVMVDVKADRSYATHLTPPVVTAHSHKNMANTIPKLVVASSDETVVLDSRAQRGVNKMTEHGLKEAKKKTRAYAKNSAPKVDADATYKWYIGDGRSFYTGAFIRIEGENLVFKNNKGNEQNLALSKLVPGALAFAKALAGESSTSTDAPAATDHELESWTSAGGKSVQARFVSLDGENVTLQNASGKSFTMPLAKLNAGSQARAKELAE